MSSTDGCEKSSIQNGHGILNGRDGEQTHPMQVILAHLDDLRRDRPTSAVENRRNRKSKITVARILIAARAVFSKHGYAGLSLRKVAYETGMAVGNLTYHFPTKENLMRAMLHEALADNVENHIANPDHLTAHPLDTLLNIVEAYFKQDQSERQFFLQVRNYANSNPEAHDMIHIIYAPFRRFAYSLISAANPGLDERQISDVAFQLFRLEDGQLLFRNHHGDKAAPTPHAKETVRALAKQIILGGNSSSVMETIAT